jgi:hypothetical protein
MQEINKATFLGIKNLVKGFLPKINKFFIIQSPNSKQNCKRIQMVPKSKQQ